MHEIQHEILITKPSEKVVLSPEIGWAKKFLSLTRLHCRMCLRIYIFNFKNTNKQTKKQEYKKAKETKEEKRVSSDKQLKK